MGASFVFGSVPGGHFPLLVLLVVSTLKSNATTRGLRRYHRIQTHIVSLELPALSWLSHPHHTSVPCEKNLCLLQKRRNTHAPGELAGKWVREIEKPGGAFFFRNRIYPRRKSTNTCFQAERDEGRKGEGNPDDYGKHRSIRMHTQNARVAPYLISYSTSCVAYGIHFV